MIRFLLFLVFVFVISTTISAQKNTSKLLASCCDVVGRCSGSASCSACTNCSACKHCSQNGGSCGVCAGSSSNGSSYTSGYNTSKSKPSRRSNRTTSSSSRLYVTSSKSLETTFYYNAVLTVRSKALNVRIGPGVDYEVIAQLGRGETVRCLETSSGEWIKIEVVESGIKGYVYKQFLE